MDSRREPDVGWCGWVMEGSLEVAEEAPGARQGKGHGPEFAKEFVPFVGGNASLAGRDAVEKL